MQKWSNTNACCCHLVFCWRQKSAAMLCYLSARITILVNATTVAFTKMYKLSEMPNHSIRPRWYHVHPYLWWPLQHRYPCQCLSSCAPSQRSSWEDHCLPYTGRIEWDILVRVPKLPKDHQWRATCCHSNLHMITDNNGNIWSLVIRAGFWRYEQYSSTVAKVCLECCKGTQKDADVPVPPIWGRCYSEVRGMVLIILL